MSKVQYRIVAIVPKIIPNLAGGISQIDHKRYSPWLDVPGKKQLAMYPGPVYINDCTPESTEGIATRIEWRLKPQ